MLGCISKSRGSTVPLVREIQSCYCYTEALVVQKTIQCRETMPTDRKPGNFQFTDRARLWLLESITSTFSLGEYRRKRKEMKLFK